MLVRVARLHSQEMVLTNRAGHDSPTTGMETAGKRYAAELGRRPDGVCIGENVLFSPLGSDDIAAHHQLLMQSPEHRANIMFPGYNRVGIGIVRDQKQRLWMTQMFLGDV